ncbi:MAG: fatty acid desaturase, partial [Bdellovibrionales bacterium]|nr:fatty acid desaturase [Bdellovibrionales bacterium]
WGLGMGLIAYYFAVEAQLNHTVMHGAFRSVEPDLHPNKYESIALPFQSRTWGDAHQIHHQNPSLLGIDPDTVHPLFRVHPETPWRSWHRLNSFLGSLTTFECWSFDYDHFLKSAGKRPVSDHSEKRKFGLHLVYQYVFFPCLAGPHWKYVLSANMVAAILRNLIFTGLQTASSVGKKVSTSHATHAPDKTPFAWFRFQIETSKNYHLPQLWRGIFGGLDRHIEHHLYPDLPPKQLRGLSDEVKNLCNQYGIEYVEYPSFWVSLKDSLSHLNRLSKIPPKRKDILKGAPEADPKEKGA